MFNLNLFYSRPLESLVSTPTVPFLTKIYTCVNKMTDFLFFKKLQASFYFTLRVFMDQGPVQRTNKQCKGASRRSVLPDNKDLGRPERSRSLDVATFRIRIPPPPHSAKTHPSNGPTFLVII